MSHYDGANTPAGGGGASPPPPPGSVHPGSTLLPELGLYQDHPQRRAIARLIDWVIVAVPVIVLWRQLVVVACHFGGVAVTCDIAGWRYVMVGVVTLTIVSGYFVGLTWFFGATPGKMLLGLSVVTEDGEVPDLETCALRGAVDAATTAVLLLPFAASRWIFIGLVAAVSVVGAVQLVGRPRQIDLYDLLGGTYVVRR
jgi:uncharacterized RDD family membrane protein YckC